MTIIYFFCRGIISWKIFLFRLTKRKPTKTRARERLGKNATFSRKLACPPSLNRARVFQPYSYFLPKLETNHSLVFVGKYWLTFDRQTVHQGWNFRIYGAPLALRALRVSHDPCLGSYFAQSTTNENKTLCVKFPVCGATKFTRAINVSMSLIAQRAINLMDNQSFLRKNVDNKLSSRRKFVDGPEIKTFSAPPLVAFPDANCSLRFVEPSCSDEKQSVSPSPQQILLTAYVYQGGVRAEDSDSLFRSPTKLITVCSIPCLCRSFNKVLLLLQKDKKNENQKVT